jgi:hypothetical protein
MSRPGIGIVKFTDAELAEIRHLFRESVQSVRRARTQRPRSHRPPTFALCAESV